MFLDVCRFKITLYGNVKLEKKQKKTRKKVENFVQLSYGWTK